MKNEHKKKNTFSECKRDRILKRDFTTGENRKKCLKKEDEKRLLLFLRHLCIMIVLMRVSSSLDSLFLILFLFFIVVCQPRVSFQIFSDLSLTRTQQLFFLFFFH